MKKRRYFTYISTIYHQIICDVEKHNSGNLGFIMERHGTSWNNSSGAVTQKEQLAEGIGHQVSKSTLRR